jgi:hypothetical protein
VNQLCGQGYHIRYTELGHLPGQHLALKDNINQLEATSKMNNITSGVFTDAHCNLGFNTANHETTRKAETTEI